MRAVSRETNRIYFGLFVHQVIRCIILMVKSTIVVTD